MSNTRYQLNGEGSPFNSAQLLYISSSKFGGDWYSVPHTHACLEIFYCVSGTGQFYISGKYFNVGRDDVVIINPGVDHTEMSLADSPLEYIVIGVEGVEFVFDKEDENLCSHNFRDRTDEILTPLRTILREIETAPLHHETVCKNLLELILVRLMRQSSTAITVSSLGENKECIEAKRYIDSNYAENITLDFLSELTHLNKYYFAHAFNREFNVSPINYLIQRRIRESKYLLENTNHSLAHISEALGFSSPSYFSQSFRRLEGMSPIQYRKQHKDPSYERTDQTIY